MVAYRLSKGRLTSLLWFFGAWLNGTSGADSGVATPWHWKTMRFTSKVVVDAALAPVKLRSSQTLNLYLPGGTGAMLA